MGTLLCRLRHSQLRARRLQVGKRGDQVVLRLHELAGVDHKERGAGLDDVPEHGNHLNHAPGIMRKYRHRQVIIDRDTAFGDLFRAKAQ